MTEREPPRNFLEQIVESHLRDGTHGGQVVTRFPPEPNGYLHIGHAKSICLNFGIAQKYGGVCHLRMDDTNPLAEEVEFVESIQADVRWLGFDWGEHFFFASAYYERLYELAVGLIKAGKAYVDDQSVEAIRAGRGTLTAPGTPSPWRDRSVEENLSLFAQMRAGAFPDGSKVLRAKIDMGARNILMRDPLMYRIRHAHHHRTGDTWCIYPMYDFAHGLSDAIEGITHSICTLEFENNRELYDWFVANTGIQPQPKQYEFARLNIDYMVMSKRKLKQLVDEAHVDGWDDPRMPTVAGLRRRGFTPESIRAFAEMVGVTKANTTIDYAKLEFAIRDDLNHTVSRVMAVVDPLEVVITNYPEGQTESLDCALYPHDHPLEGSRAVPFGRTIYIDRSDFAAEPPKGWRRLAPGVEVRLRYAYFVTCERVITDADGQVVRLECRYDPATRGGAAPDNRKVAGTLHWVAAEGAVPAEFRLYDRLFTEAAPGARTGDPLDDLNPESLTVQRGWVEPSIAAHPAGTRYQFERTGYFISDSEDSQPGGLVFNRIVTLRDTWAKQVSKADAAPAAASQAPAARRAEKARPAKRTKAQIRAHERAADPALAARYATYQADLGLDEETADLLTGEAAVADLFDQARAAYAGDLAGLAKWFVNELAGALGDRDTATLPTDGAALAALVALVDAGTVTSRAAKDVLEVLLAEGGAPAAIVKARGLEVLDDSDALARTIDGVVAAHADMAARFRGGEQKLFGFFIGQVMQATGGKADPKAVRALLTARLTA